MVSAQYYNLKSILLIINFSFYTKCYSKPFSKKIVKNKHLTLYQNLKQQTNTVNLLQILKMKINLVKIQLLSMMKNLCKNIML